MSTSTTELFLLTVASGFITVVVDYLCSVYQFRHLTILFSFCFLLLNKYNIPSAEGQTRGARGRERVYPFLCSVGFGCAPKGG